jgi:mono/diheme cytochrome c family protein
MSHDLHQHEPPPPAAPRVAGMLAEFAGPDALKAAAAQVRDAGFRCWDAHSPYPVHGIERAMGLRPTRLPWLVLAAGLAGAALALGLQWWTNSVDYPINISGKPIFGLPANVPIIFELMVLLAAFAAFGGALALNLLPQFWHPVFNSPRFKRATADGFFLSIEARDPQFDEPAVRALLKSAGATAVETLHDSDAGRKFPGWLGWAATVAVVLALAPPLCIAFYRAAPKSQPRIHIIQDMDFQPKYKAQAPSKLFADGRAMRLPIEGTVRDGGLEADDHLYRGLVDGKPATTFPIPVDMQRMERGRERFDIYCAACHGLTGEGGVTGIVSARAIKRKDVWTLPLNLHADSVREQPVGKLFDTISNGIRKMPAYGPQIPPEDRWAIVLYVRALQRSRHATLDDVPEPVRANLLK